MKKAIEILEQHIRSYRSMMELYAANPHNQAVTEYTAKEAAVHILNLQTAIAALNAAETGQLPPNTASLKLPGWDAVESFIRNHYSHPSNSESIELCVGAAKTSYDFIASQLQA